jgi:hypothetical protein
VDIFTVISDTAQTAFITMIIIALYSIIEKITYFTEISGKFYIAGSHFESFIEAEEAEEAEAALVLIIPPFLLLKFFPPPAFHLFFIDFTYGVNFAAL